MEVAKENMVRNEYPVSEKEGKEEKEEEMDTEAMQPEENNRNDDVRMEFSEGEFSNDINGCLEYDVYSDDIGAAHIKALEDELDHLQSALDHLEKKNDDIHAELIDLLQSNREAREQIRESLCGEIDKQQLN